MRTFDHAKLVRREPVELARFRGWVLGGQAGNIEGIAVLHEPNGKCCRREPWNTTATAIITALAPTTPQVLINVNQPTEGDGAMNALTARGFTGWHRPSPRSPWRAIVAAESETSAFRLLLDAVAGGDKCVLPAGTDPNKQRRPR